MHLRVLFIEPPKDVWFVMGEYLPPPYGIIQLAAYLERENRNIQVEILDCNADKVDWKAMEQRIAASNPDVVACASLSTCNTYAVVKTLETAKRITPHAFTVTGGQHFTATAQESLRLYPVIDAIVRNEGEQTLSELVKALQQGTGIGNVEGVSFRSGGSVVHNRPRPLIGNLEDLPFPGYHLVKENMHKYHFSVMAGKNAPFALIEGARGCNHQCTFCTQWRHWQACWRLKSAKRIADEMEYCSHEFGSQMIWLTDDNFGTGQRPMEIAEEIITKQLPSDVSWFVQARCDDIIRNKAILPRLAKSGLNWVLLGVENSNPATLDYFKKGITPNDAKAAVRLLQENGIFAHAMVIIGNRKETSQSIRQLQEFANDLDPDFIMFGILTPFPGTEVYAEAERNGWIEDRNWSHYDMIHAIMPTETFSTHQVQEELYGCYRSFYGSWNRRFRGLFSSNAMKRRTFIHMASWGVMGKVKSMF
ncbi:MAG: B12-binding domain-containing radical SAM protein [Candidatus Bathyarchaeota archaeon]|nr:B12-binding domain-containing radical SAM protein [Candidatus Bathyarchaeota archaeon]